MLVKQIPKGEEMTIVDGRLNRIGVGLEVNAYCRRANAKATELAGDDGEVVVFTMGPPSADEALREMIACGASRGVHLCDPEFAGSDTLATAKALALAIVKEGPFDLVLCGLNSLDADTGQVGPEIAELLALPFIAAARELDVVDGVAEVRSETDSGYETVRVSMPAVISAAERLTDPSKAKPEVYRDVEPGRIKVLDHHDLDLNFDEVGLAGSPTRVGVPRVLVVSRRNEIVENAEAAVDLLAGLGALDISGDVVRSPIPETGGDGPAVWCFIEPDDDRPHRELLGEAAVLAAAIGGSVSAITAGTMPEHLLGELGAQGADHVVVLPGEQAHGWAAALAKLAASRRPRVLLVEGTQAGRTIASTVAARSGWGLTGDGIETEISGDGSLTVWKPALGGRLVVPITSSSPVQIATVRPGVIARRALRSARPVTVEQIDVTVRTPIEVVAFERVDHGRSDLAGARTIIAVGQGVLPDDYPLLGGLQAALGGALLAATRKVTDKGWMPRSRQIGVTGLSISPHLFVSIGASGRFNHASGFQTAQFVLALNNDPTAEIFQHADVGLVGHWQDSVKDLVEAVTDYRLQHPAPTVAAHPGVRELESMS